MPGTLSRSRFSFARCHSRDKAVERRAGLRTLIPPAPHRPNPSAWPSDRLTISWLGHSTLLLNLHGTWLLTDPALRSRIGVALGPATFGPRRLIQPALNARELPALDAVLISHAHMDHLDLGTLRQLPGRTPVVVSRGNADLLTRFSRVEELGWGERTRVGDVSIEAIPARHWGARLITDTARGYGGFLLEQRGRRILFAGDTAHTDLYRRFRARGPIDLAILPIGAYDPWIDNHATPEQAWAMGRDMDARFVLPIHHSTFRLSREPELEPMRRFLAAAGDERRRVVLTEVGETWELAP